MKRSFPPAELNYSLDVLLSTKITYPLIGQKRKGNMVSRRMQKSRNSKCWILGAGFWIPDTGCSALPVTSFTRSISHPTSHIPLTLNHLTLNTSSFVPSNHLTLNHLKLKTSSFSHLAGRSLAARWLLAFIILPLSFLYPFIILSGSFEDCFILFLLHDNSNHVSHIP